MPTRIKNLGPCEFRSPLKTASSLEIKFRSDDERVLLEHRVNINAPPINPKDESVQSFELAGPREKLFFDPSRATAGIVTCGGLCPGLNDIIKGLVTQLWTRYGVTKILGFRYGYQGLVQSQGHTPITFRPESVKQIHLLGGSILGSSRGNQPVGEMVDTLEDMGVDILFVIGGDGSLKGAQAITDEIERRGLKKAVVGIPKTIDNDIQYLDKSFGFETAFAEALKVVRAAHAESLGAPNGIGLVRLMGRESGFISSYAALADGNVDFVLIPEVHFQLEGERGLLEAIRYKIARKKSAVIVVAEGAGQELMEGYEEIDASGNKRPKDIGIFLRDKITGFFKDRRIDLTLKYIDPSYAIRSVPANAQDNFFCQHLAQHAVHAAMTGKTGMLVGRWHSSYVHVPIPFVTTIGRNKVDPHGELWRAVLESTNQPANMQ